MRSSILTANATASLGLPNELRSLPDLLIADPVVTWARLVEVKLRNSFSQATAEELYVTLADQREFWPQSYAVVMIGEPFFPEARFHQDYLRVIPPNETARLLGPQGIDIPEDERGQMHLLWEQLPTLSSIFRFSDFEVFGEQRDQRGRSFFGSADFITQAIRDLGRL